MENAFENQENDYGGMPNTPKRRWSAGKIVALALSCAVIGGILGGSGVALYEEMDEDWNEEPKTATSVLEGKRENTVLDIVKIDTSKLMTPAEVYATNVNSTVGITTAVTTNYWGYQTTSAASGSGFILSDDGYILTNYHVVKGSDSITVSLYNDSSYDAALIGYDESNDIAVLKVEAKDLVPVVLGDSDNMNVGDSVVAIGNPLGELTFSLTAGTISAMDREITMSTGAMMNLLQTDCAINSGNSGGALFNLYGEVIGVTNAKYSGSGNGAASIDNIGFAIPVNHIRGIVQSIIEQGYFAKPFIGVSVTDVSKETQSYGLPQGAAIRAVTEGSPAEKAGLQVNDIITKAGQTEITGRSALSRVIGGMSPGDTLNLQIYRGGAWLEITVKVGEQIQPALHGENGQPQKTNTFRN